MLAVFFFHHALVNSCASQAVFFIECRVCIDRRVIKALSRYIQNRGACLREEMRLGENIIRDLTLLFFSWFSFIRSTIRLFYFCFFLFLRSSDSQTAVDREKYFSTMKIIFYQFFFLNTTSHGASYTIQ